MGPALPGFSVADILLPSGDGREIYVFNSSGRHLKTLEALTGALRYQFGYNTAGDLDVDHGRQRQCDDDPKNRRHTDRHRRARRPAHRARHERRRLAHPREQSRRRGAHHELLRRWIDAELHRSAGHIHRFTYDALGRLIKNEDPAGGSTTLSRTEQSNGYTVTTTTALGRARAYQVEQLPTGAIRRSVNADCCGGNTGTLINTDGSEETTSADGRVATVQSGPDPRWGVLATVAANVRLTTPGGLTRTITTTRSATLSNPTDLLSLTNLTDTVTDNGAVSTLVFDGTSRSFTSTTAAGRSGTLTLDAHGRVTQGQIAALAPVGYVYDSSGLLSTITEGSGATSRTTSLVYNSARDLSGITDALGRTVNFAYDSAGRVVTQTLPDGLDHPIQLRCGGQRDRDHPARTTGARVCLHADRPDVVLHAARCWRRQ